MASADHLVCLAAILTVPNHPAQIAFHQMTQKGMAVGWELLPPVQNRDQSQVMVANHTMH